MIISSASAEIAVLAAVGLSVLKGSSGENLGGDDDPNLVETSAWGRYWVSPLSSNGIKCGGTRIKTGDGGDYTCITEGEGICRDNYPGSFGTWTFGVKDGNVTLFTPNNDISWQFCADVTHVCIGEDHEYGEDTYSQERPYLLFYDEKLKKNVGEVRCDGTDGKDDENIGKPSILKMVDNSHLGPYVDYGEFGIIVTKFKKGQTEDPLDFNDLFEISVDKNAIGEAVVNPDKCTIAQECTRCSGNILEGEYEEFDKVIEFDLEGFCAKLGTTGKNGTDTINRLSAEEKKLFNEVLGDYLNEVERCNSLAEGILSCPDVIYDDIDVFNSFENSDEEFCGSRRFLEDERQLQRRKRSRGRGRSSGRSRRGRRKRKKRRILQMMPSTDSRCPPDLAKMLREKDPMFEDVVGADADNITDSIDPVVECVSDFEQLTLALEEADCATGIAPINLCTGTIMFRDDFILLGRCFELECVEPPCTLDLNGFSIELYDFDKSIINGINVENGFSELFGGTRRQRGSTGRGGCFYIYQSFGNTSSFEVTNSIFKNCSASVHGGALYALDIANVSISSSVFEGNVAAAGAGGGLSFYSGFNITNSLLSISDTEFLSNFAGVRGDGGAICASEVAQVSISSSFFENNTATSNITERSRGGGMLMQSGFRILDSELIVSDSNFSSNSVTGTSGGAICAVEIAKVSISSCLFEGNSVIFDITRIPTSSAPRGGGIHIIYFDVIDSKANISDTQFMSNEVSAFGAGLSAQDIASLSVSSCLFEENTAKSINDEISTGPRGAGIIIFNGANIMIDSQVSISDTQFKSNNAFVGGALFAQNYAPDYVASLSISSCQFESNEASQVAGALVTVNFAEVSISDTQFKSNKASDVGALLAQDVASLSISSCLFDENFAIPNEFFEFFATGGGIGIRRFFRIEDSKASISETEFKSNKASDFGGAISTFDISSLSTSSCRFEDNAVDDPFGEYGEGGAIDISSFFVKTLSNFSNSEFISNHASSAGGALHFLDASEFTINDGCVFKNNTAGCYGGAISNGPFANTNGSISNSTFYNNNIYNYTNNNNNANLRSTGKPRSFYNVGEYGKPEQVFHINRRQLQDATINVACGGEDIFDNDPVSTSCPNVNGDPNDVVFCNATGFNTSVSTNFESSICAGACTGKTCPGCP